MTPHPARAVVVAVLLISALPAAQRDRVMPPAGTGRVAGTVRVDGTDQPVRRALVSLYGSDRQVGRAVATDDEGRFELEGLPPGRYQITASRPGFVSIPYGARRPDGPQQPMVLAAGEARRDVNLRLAPGAVISGTVRDESGKAVSDIEVRIDPEPRDVGGITVRTDDRGQYRAFGLPPSAYIVSVVPRIPGSGALQMRTDSEVDAAFRYLQSRRAAPAAPVSRPVAHEQAPAARTIEYAPVFHPGTSVQEDARVVVVAAGEERLGIDIVLRPMAAVTLRGQLIETSNEPGAVIDLTLTKAGASRTAGTSHASIQTGGRFEFGSVTPGRYLLAARITSPAAARASLGLPPDPKAPAVSVACRFSAQELIVSGQDVTTVLQPRPCLNLRWEVRVDPRAGNTSSLAGVRMQLRPIASSPVPATIAQIAGTTNDDGRMSLGGVGELLPGTYLVSLELPPALRRFTVSSVMHGAQDLLDHPLRIPSDGLETDTLIVTVSDQRSTLAGTLESLSPTPFSGYTVVAFPAARALWIEPSRRFRTARAGSDGRFTFDDVPAGDYRIAVLADDPPPTWRSASFLEQLMDMSVVVTIAPGEQKIQNLRVGR